MILTGAGIQRSGKSSAVQVNGTKLAFSTYQMTWSSADQKTNNFKCFVSTAYSSDGFQLGQSYDEAVQGFLSANGSFGGDWDAGVNPIDTTAPPGLYPRDNVQNVLLMTSVLDAVEWDFPYGRIRSAQNGSTAEGLVTFSVGQFMNQGVFIGPIGSSLV